MIIVFDVDGRYLALADGIDPSEYADSIGGTVVTMVSDTPTAMHEPLIDGTWHIPEEVIYANAAAIETRWRLEQMPAALETLTAIQLGEIDILGTEQQWKDYWLSLRKWIASNPDFPDANKRPVQPS
ncbi:hypothetical protein [Pseudomonas trivialis]|uniref:Tail fiber assembly protein n=1 Tax=Pseudomonas trivialis TaxID=200450 RepID=A0A0H5AWZ2_9PSED|nr:hypothetical protein [Pseudomonas trivialis]AKS09062.1 hypothetical protein AA957_24065 [Pseudomonas trivialis]